VSLRDDLASATRTLTEAGVPNARADALLLAAHVLGVDRSEAERRALLGSAIEPAEQDRLEALVAERARRVPLQHLTGRAPFRHLELAVGPGVFVPRPETEMLVDLVLAESPSTVVDLCTGSGAIPLAVAQESPGAQVLAVELSPEALAWARHNIDATGLPVELVAADATADPGTVPELADLVGLIDVVVSNPPYIPTDMVPVDPEVAEHDPQIALYGGSSDGLAIPLAVARVAARLLRPGGLLVMEHAETQGESLPASLRRTGEWTDVRDADDLTGRPRAVLARRA
jgi:release factor glutamine methyltransferase